MTAMTFTGGEIKSRCVFFFFCERFSSITRPTTRLHYCSSAALSDTIEEGTSREGWLRRNMSPCDGGGTMMTDSAAKQWTLEGGSEARQGWRTGVEQSDTDTSCLPLAGFTLRSVFWFARLVSAPRTSLSTCFAKSFLENIFLNSF